MRKFLTLAITALLSASAVTAVAQMKLPEAQKRIEEGRAMKLSSSKIHPGNNLNGIPVMKQPSSEAFVSDIMETRQLANPPLKKVPARITDSGSLIYGFASSSGDQVTNPKGLYEINSASVRMMWRDKAYNTIGYNIQTGFALDGKLMGTGMETFSGYLFGYASFVYDIATGELESVNEHDDFRENESVIIYDVMSYNPTDGNVYGICQARDGNYHWYSTTPSELTSGNDLGETSRDVTGMCWSSAENCFVAVTDKGYLIKIDLDGSYENMFKIDGDFDFGYYSGITYSPVDKVYYVNLRNDKGVYLATVDPVTHKTAALYPTPSNLHFTILYCDDVIDLNPKMPKTPKLKSIDFLDGSTSGTVTYTMPTEAEDGTKLEGELRAFASAGSNTTGPEGGYVTAPGEVLTVEYKDLPNGFNMFRLYVTHDGLRSQSSNETYYVGNDTPASPARVVFSADKISWPRVSRGVHGGFVSKDDMKYEVYVNDELVGETKSLSYQYTLPKDEEYQLYTASVVAVCRDLKSEPTTSRSIAYGKAFDLPYRVIPNDDQAALIINENVDNDGSYWWYNDHYDSMLSGYTADDPRLTGIDWMFLPPVKIDSMEKFYTLAFEMNTLHTLGTGDLALEVWCGPEPNSASMTTQILASTGPSEIFPDFEYLSMLFQPGFTGDCYIGFRAYTKDSNSQALGVKQILVDDHNITLESPQEPFNISAIPADQGVLSATVTFNMPRRRINEESIASGTEITAYVWVDRDNRVSVTGKPGERVSLTVPTVQGNNEIYVMASIDGHGSLPARVQAYTGVVVPETPKFKRSTVTPDMQQMSVEWEPVTTGVNNGFIVPEDVTYELYQPVTFVGVTTWEKVKDLGHVTNYTYTCPEGMPMQFVSLGFGSRNAAGSNGKLFGVQTLLGTPYTLPAVENFNNGFQLMPWVSENPGSEYADNSFSLIPLSELFDEINSKNENALAGTGAVGTKGYLNAPRFTTTGVTGGSVKAYLYTGYGAAPIKVYARVYGQSLTEIGSITPDRVGNKFEEFIFDLPSEFLGQMWVQVVFEPQYEEGGQTFMLNAFEASNVSGVNEVETSTSIYAGKGFVTIDNHMGDDVTIYNAVGMVVANLRAESDHCVYPVAEGVYVVMAGSQKAKLIVR